MQQNKIRILTWAVALLLALNVATIGTILYHIYQEKNVINTSNINSRGNKMNGRFFRDELNLNNEQMHAFHAINVPFRAKTHATINSIDSTKYQLYKELQQTMSDTTKIKNLSAQIGLLQSDLSKETAIFYLNVKNICNDKQQEKLAEIFYPLFRNNVADTFQRRGNRNF